MSLPSPFQVIIGKSEPTAHGVPLHLRLEEVEKARVSMSVIDRIRPCAEAALVSVETGMKGLYWSLDLRPRKAMRVGDIRRQGGSGYSQRSPLSK